jgi:hypothetical protein
MHFLRVAFLEHFSTTDIALQLTNLIGIKLVRYLWLLAIVLLHGFSVSDDSDRVFRTPPELHLF